MKDLWRTLGVLAVSIAGIYQTQPTLAGSVARVRLRDDVALIPGPKEVKTLALGYDSAMADLVWTRLLLEYGRHWSEKRYFRDAGRFLDVLVELDPTFAPTFLYADTFLTYQPTPDNHSTATLDDVLAARKFLELGLQRRPRDHELWLHYGQFLAFRATAFVDVNSPEWDAWRKDGSLAIMHAMELGASVDKTMAAASILGRAGEREATVRYLERAYALSDDEDQRANIRAKLAFYKQSALEEADQRAQKRLDSVRSRTYPFLSRGAFLLMGPMPDALGCAGRRDDPSCAFSWDVLLAKPQ